MGLAALAGGLAALNASCDCCRFCASAAPLPTSDFGAAGALATGAEGAGVAGEENFGAEALGADGAGEVNFGAEVLLGADGTVTFGLGAE